MHKHVMGFTIASFLMLQGMCAQCAQWQLALNLRGKPVSFFVIVRSSTLNKTQWLFNWNISNNKIREFGVCCSRICSGSVLCGQLLVNNEALITPNMKCKEPVELFQKVKSFILFVIIEPISLKDVIVGTEVFLRLLVVLLFYFSHLFSLLKLWSAQAGGKYAR